MRFALKKNLVSEIFILQNKLVKKNDFIFGSSTEFLVGQLKSIFLTNGNSLQCILKHTYFNTIKQRVSELS